ncbi:hypothetical protein K438DRAFT_1978080 [Mycena galopus ATCC 62051]|nr:hypothetical protein K438DRAFT_1978080 [Mycena galopus ATCC 62051]
MSLQRFSGQAQPSSHLLGLEMPPAVPEDTVSTAASALPTKLFAAVLVLTAIGTMICYTLPLRLTSVLLTNMKEAEKIYLEAHGLGLRSPTDTQTLDSLKLKVSHIVQETICNSDSWRATLCDFLRGRTFILLQCIYEVHCFEARIKTLKELAHLRAEGNLNTGTIPFPQLESGMCDGGSHSQAQLGY